MTKPKNGRSKTPVKLKKVTPTQQQKTAFKVWSDMVRKTKGKKFISIGKVLKEAGYSKTIQRSPTKVTKTRGWLQLLEEKFPDDKLSDKMDEQLQARSIDHYAFPAFTTDKEIKKTIEGDFGFKVMRIIKVKHLKRAYFSIPDHIARDKIIDKILKLKNKYPAEKHEHLIAKVEIVKYEDSP